jgi:SAM-dependent methyltransferase
VRGEQVDAVLTATALHWLSEPVVRRLYEELVDVVRPGGVFAHLEVMPLLEQAQGAATPPDPNDGRTEWDEWWEAAARDPLLTAAVADRRGVFDGNYPTEEFSPPADWHINALRDAGFAEADVVWRSGSSAIVAAVR